MERLEVLRRQKKALEKSQAALAWNELQIACDDASMGLRENEIPVYAESVIAMRRARVVYEAACKVLGLEVVS